MSIDFKLDDNHDITISDFDFQFVDGADALVQRLLIKLRTYKNEWFLDTTFGIPYHQDILGKSKDVKFIESIFKNAILEDSEVKQLVEFDMTYISLTRQLTITFTAERLSGEEINFSEVV